MNGLIGQRGKVSSVLMLLGALLTYSITPVKHRWSDLAYGLIWVAAIAVVVVVIVAIVRALRGHVRIARLIIAGLVLLGIIAGFALALIVTAVHLDKIHWWSTRGLMAYLPLIAAFAASAVLDTMSKPKKGRRATA